MLGSFQQSHLRLEIAASEKRLRDSLLRTSKLRQWLLLPNFSPNLSERLEEGLIFTSAIGLIAIQHQVIMVNDKRLRLLLSQGIDGYHEWSWGEGWIQSRLEGVSLLPLSLGQTLSLLRLKQFVTSQPD